MSYLLDTNIISELMKPSPHQLVLRWVDVQATEALCLSAITIGALLRGVAKLPGGAKRDMTHAIIVDSLVPQFMTRIIPLDAAIMGTWATLTTACEQRGRMLPAIDSFIAATAAHHQLTLVTRNTRDFDAAGIPLLNPWEQPASMG